MIEQAKKYMQTYYERHIDARVYPYHSWDHIQSVYQGVSDLGKMEQVSETELQALQIAALFHDAGIHINYEAHEKESVKIATEYLEEQKSDQSFIDLVNQLIFSTDIRHEPSGKLEKIIKDADLSNLGTKAYAKASEDLRNEWEYLGVRSFESDLDFYQQQLMFIEGHKFYSKSSKALFSRKKKNIKELKQIIKEVQIDNEKLKTKLNNNKTGQMILKTALRNHINMSQLADNKASTMLSVNALIITISIPMMIPRIAENKLLLLPTAILLFGCIVSVLIATLVTKPFKMKGISEKEDIQNGNADLFFFGNFYKMDFNSYKEGMETTLYDDSLLDQSIFRDLFSSGQALGSKYSKLRTCYTVFIIGLVLSTLSYIVVLFI
jgi:predicted metal-dependent HD superfamily phosphohydrolase